MNFEKEKEKEKGELIDSDSFLLRCNDILFCTLASERHSACQRALQRLPANITTAFAGTCQNMTQSVQSHSSSTLGGEYIFYV